MAEWRPDFVLEGPERERLVRLLADRCSIEDLRALLDRLGIRHPIGQGPEQLASELIDRSLGPSQQRRLVRALRKRAQFKEFANDVLQRTLDDDAQLKALVDLLHPSANLWGLMYPLLLSYTALYGAEMTIKGWDEPPASKIVFEDRCEELVDILNELPRRKDLPLSSPLLQFVREAFCTPIGSNAPKLRFWLREAAASLGLALVDLLVYDGQNGEARPLVDALQEAAGGELDVSIETLPAEETPQTWAPIMSARAVRIAVYVDSPTQLSLLKRTKHWNPSYSAIVPVLAASLDPRTQPLPDEWRNVPMVRLEPGTIGIGANRLFAMVTNRVPQQAPVPPPEPKPESARPLTKEQDRVVEALRDGKLVIFFGPSEYERASPASSLSLTSGFRLGHQLVSRLQKSLADTHPIAAIDFAGYIYKMKKREREWRRDLADLVRLRPGELPRTHTRLAQLLKALDRHPDGLRRAQPLIVTTNLDSLIERALLEAGLSFCRFVQTAGRLVSNKYVVVASSNQQGDAGYSLKGYQGFDLRTACDRPAGCTRLQFLIRTSSSVDGSDRMPWQEGDPPIVLYKHHGSADSPDDLECILSFEDYDQRPKPPGPIATAVADRTRLFVGYTVLDPQLRHLKSCLFTDKKPLSYAVHSMLADDCLDETVACLPRTVWAEMSSAWQEEYHTRRLDNEDAASFLEMLERGL